MQIKLKIRNLIIVKSKISVGNENLDFTILKFRNFEPNLHFMDLNFVSREKKILLNLINYILLLNNALFV